MCLIPVSRWVYDLYAIRYMDREGGRTLSVALCVDTGMSVDIADEHAPPACTWIEWYVVEEGVAPPKIIGSIYGTPIHESGWSAGKSYER